MQHLGFWTFGELTVGVQQDAAVCCKPRPWLDSHAVHSRTKHTVFQFEAHVAVHISHLDQRQLICNTIALVSLITLHMYAQSPAYCGILLHVNYARTDMVLNIAIWSTRHAASTNILSQSRYSFSRH